MKLRDIMSAEVETATPGTSVADAARMMRDFDTGFIPVVQSDELMGVITDRDITIRVTAAGLNPFDVSIADFMSPNIVSIGPDASAEEAAALMAEKQVRRLLVVEGQKLVGVVSLGDLATKIGGGDEEVGEALTSISEPAEGMER